MIRIGDFSKLSRISIKTLRYYDEMGLLKPIEVDRFTGYRYYEFDQLPQLNRILALRDLGFSLEEIRQLLTDGLTPEQMRGMLKLRQADIRQQMQEQTGRLERVEARLRQIEQEKNMSKYDVVIKKVEPIKVASIRDIIPTYPEQGHLWCELEGYLAMHRACPSGACFTIYYDEDYREHDIDAEVCEQIESDLSGTRRVKVYVLPDVATMACTVHHGPFVTINEAYSAIMKWIDENGYRINGPGREIYLRGAKDGNQNDPKTVTEIQFPVEKA